MLGHAESIIEKYKSHFGHGVEPCLYSKHHLFEIYLKEMKKLIKTEVKKYLFELTFSEKRTIGGL